MPERGAGARAVALNAIPFVWFGQKNTITYF
jgi:hypothetical protein